MMRKVVVINGGKRDASIGRPGKLGDMEPARPSSHGMAQCIGPTPTRTFLIILSGLMRMTTAIGRSSTTISSTAYSFRMGRLTSEMRVNALLTAAKTIQPVLEDFYGTLNYEQKARFNTLDRDLARGT